MKDEPQLKVVDIPGRLPPVWEENVIFYANLMGLFYGNEAETEELRRIVGNVNTYGGRLLPVLNLLYKGDHNWLILEHEPAHDLLGYFRDVLRLSLPRYTILTHRDYLEVDRRLEAGDVQGATDLLPAVTPPPDTVVDGYITDETLVRIARLHGLSTQGRPSGSRQGNNKLLLHQYMARTGFPVFDTRIAGDTKEIESALAHFKASGYRRAVIKSQVGASGVGMWRIDLAAEDFALPKNLEMLFYEGPCLVQGWLEPGLFGITQIRSPSVQLFLSHDAVYLYDVTEQILSHASVHEGNEAPPAFLDRQPRLLQELLERAGSAGRWLHQTGYRGTASADFVVPYEAKDQPRHAILCELNARVTGATYPAMLARHFYPEGAWLMRNMKLSEPLPGASLLDWLKQEGVLFEPGKSAGVLPINFNLTSEHQVVKTQFLCLAESLTGCRELIQRARETLITKMEYDRD